jgi:hypothetical protein
MEHLRKYPFLSGRGQSVAEFDSSEVTIERQSCRDFGRGSVFSNSRNLLSRFQGAEFLTAVLFASCLDVQPRR